MHVAERITASEGYLFLAIGVWLMLGFALWMMNLKAPKTNGEFDSASRKMMKGD